MLFLEWNDSLKVDVPVIDEQHQRLIKMINDLHHAMTEGQGPKALRRIVDGMAAYAASHFAVEEKFMSDLGYLGYPYHKSEHDNFTKKAEELQQRLASGSFVLSLEVITYLRDWWSEHILTVDKRLGAFINQQVRRGI